MSIGPSRIRKHFGFVLLASSALIASMSSCNDDDDADGGGEAGAGANSGGSNARGGMSGRGGTGGSAPTAGEAGRETGGGAGAGAAGGDGGVDGDGGADGDGGTPADRDVFRPTLRPFTESSFGGLELPEGFAINVFARNMQHARMLGVHGTHVYLTRPEQGDVLRLVDVDADGVAESTVTVASGLANVHGIAFDPTSVFLATDKRVLRGTVSDTTGDFSGLVDIIADLPDGGQHPLRTLGVGTDSMLYISVGSSCDACPETNLEHATILRAALDGSTRSVFASGLRNTIGFDWHPETGQIWGMDHGSDWRGDDLPPEELNRIEMGESYGRPYCFADRQTDPIIEDPPGTTKETYCASTVGSVLVNQAHGAPIGMVFYDGASFPDEYVGDAFVALHGSWNRFPPTGYKVVRIRFDEGMPVSFEDFVTGFLIEDGAAQFGRPAGIAVAPDGSLLFTDDDNGMIYRVSPVQ